MAAGDLTTLANLKLWLGITQSTDDAQLGRLITAASDFVKAYMSRDIVPTTYTSEPYHGNGNDTLVLRNWPVTAVASLTIDGTAAASTDFTIYDRMIYLANGKVFNTGRANVVVTYTAGYAVTPPSIEQAVIELCSMKYRERDRIGHSSKAVGSETVAFIVADLHPNIKAILVNWANKVPT